jgi:hypothetical protein
MKRIFLTILLIGVSPPRAAAAASGVFKESLSQPAALAFRQPLPAVALAKFGEA